MDTEQFLQNFPRITQYIDTDAVCYEHPWDWDSLGCCPQDRNLTELAEFCLHCTMTQQQKLIQTVHPSARKVMLQYAKRAGFLMLKDEPFAWYRRALAILHLEDGKLDSSESDRLIDGLRAAASIAGIGPICWSRGLSFDRVIKHPCLRHGKYPPRPKIANFIFHYGPAGLLALKRLGIQVRDKTVESKSPSAGPS